MIWRRSIGKPCVWRTKPLIRLARSVAGNICNTWAYKPDDAIAVEEVRRQYTEQVGWAASEKVDFILAETIEYVGEL